MDAIIEQIILQMPTVGVLVYLVYRLDQRLDIMTQALIELLEDDEKY